VKRSLYLIAAILLVTILLVFGITGCGSEEEGNFINVAITGPMTNIQGEMMWWGAEVAAEEINAAGGVQIGEETYQVKLVKVDTNEIFSVDDAVTAVENVVQNVDFFLGGFRTEAVTPYTELVVKDYQKIFLICGAATNELLAPGRIDEDYDTWKYLFRVTPIKSTDLVTVTVLMLNDVAMAVRQATGEMKPKVAILAENLTWNEALVTKAPFIFESLGLEYVDTWRPSATASDVTTELKAIQDSGAHIIYTIMSGPVGIPYGKQWGQLEIPACSVGINVEAQKSGYIAATDGFGNYDFTLNTYARVAISESTISFIDKFVAKYNQVPNYNAGTYDALLMLMEAVGRAGSLESDAVVAELEKVNREAPRLGTSGNFAFDENHDVIWGPGFVTAVGIQWVDDEIACAWPYQWKPKPKEMPDFVFGYEGAVPYKIPPWVLEQWQQ
jgi:branched-chain amino acid transport system substrate-binding protein